MTITPPKDYEGYTAWRTRVKALGMTLTAVIMATTAHALILEMI